MISPTLQILIIEPSFLIREGLKTLLSQIGLAYRIEEFEFTVENIPKLIQKTNPKLVFLNPALLSDKEYFNRLEASLSEIIFIGLIPLEVPLNKQSQFDYLLNVFAPKAELIKSMESILSKSGILIPDNDSGTLSDRENDVLKLVALGLTNNEISEKLFISIHTVMTHRKNITRKLGIKTVSGLTVYAILNKLIKAEELKGTIDN
ncbi:MAG: DNA-binding response regulator [Bacteroidetes bacterium HGW-Bacteroidetes-1]|jgi:DNA-binding NarL/FixJ family response regulator|nr:MAG: DNA-binding response regulator [Bacteroidetes bacterium HGW-Bacteroidetes-1]